MPPVSLFRFVLVEVSDITAIAGHAAHGLGAALPPPAASEPWFPAGPSPEGTR
ncbi:hypothetical protein GCM10018792_24310 [Streptomyces rubradiris]|nr:hypothetical protein GCM10018792_24310 [Streptomyces rubradiris]